MTSSMKPSTLFKKLKKLIDEEEIGNINKEVLRELKSSFDLLNKYFINNHKDKVLEEGILCIFKTSEGLTRVVTNTSYSEWCKFAQELELTGSYEILRSFITKKVKDIDYLFLKVLNNFPTLREDKCCSSFYDEVIDFTKSLKPFRPTKVYKKIKDWKKGEALEGKFFGTHKTKFGEQYILETTSERFYLNINDNLRSQMSHIEIGDLVRINCREPLNSYSKEKAIFSIQEAVVVKNRNTNKEMKIFSELETAQPTAGNLGTVDNS